MYKYPNQLPWLILSSCLFIGGCVTQILSPGAEKVYVTAAAVPASCHFVGSVSSTTINGSTVAYTSLENLKLAGISSLKNQTYNLGGNYIVLNQPVTTTTQRPAYSIINSEQMSGKAYKCPANTYYGPVYYP